MTRSASHPKGPARKNKLTAREYLGLLLDDRLPVAVWEEFYARLGERTPGELTASRDFEPTPWVWFRAGVAPEKYTKDTTLFPAITRDAHRIHARVFDRLGRIVPSAGPIAEAEGRWPCGVSVPQLAYYRTRAGAEIALLAAWLRAGRPQRF